MSSYKPLTDVERKEMWESVIRVQARLNRVSFFGAFTLCVASVFFEPVARYAWGFEHGGWVFGIAHLACSFLLIRWFVLTHVKLMHEDLFKARAPLLREVQEE